MSTDIFRNFSTLTASLKAFRRKKALQDSQEIASKLQPNATSPHTPHLLSDLGGSLLSAELELRI